jgi:hypothetical protein
MCWHPASLRNPSFKSRGNSKKKEYVERRLVLPLPTLYGLMAVSGRENVPGWARPLLEEVENGKLNRAIHTVLE